MRLIQYVPLTGVMFGTAVIYASLLVNHAPA